MNKWDARFMDMAMLVATFSKDDSTKVGSVIVDPCNRVVSVGFNGAPRGVSDTYRDRDQKLRRTLHAESNALSFAHRDVDGCTAYVTHPPCSNCAALLIQRGIARVVFPEPSEGFLSRWQISYDESIDMFMEASVAVCILKGTP
jgi:dCMP deaminase